MGHEIRFRAHAWALAGDEQGRAEYFGWNEKGSLIKNLQDGRIYFWNLKQDSLRVAYPDERSIPPGVLVSLHKLDNVPTRLAVAMAPKK